VTNPAPPAFLVSCQPRVAALLERVLPPVDLPPANVHRAMRHTVLAPSKRVRAALALASAEVCGREARGEALAVAVELVHAASLILDDLPSMDNAPMRRGRAACHVEFGEATALLAAFDLLARAFGIVAREYEAPVAAKLVSLLSEAVGSDGLVGGQADDLRGGGEAFTFERLERIHRLKTGVLFSAAAAGGGLAAGGTPPQLAALGTYAKNLGLAFQIVDDLLDVEGDPAETGKLTRSDVKKTTFLSFSGVAGAHQLAHELCEVAASALAPLGTRAARLRELASYVAARVS